jgi:hypothetical protein
MGCKAGLARFYPVLWGAGQRRKGMLLNGLAGALYRELFMVARHLAIYNQSGTL